jgi:hypothetical protein
MIQKPVLRVEVGVPQPTPTVPAVTIAELDFQLKLIIRVRPITTTKAVEVRETFSRRNDGLNVANDQPSRAFSNLGCVKLMHTKKKTREHNKNDESSRGGTTRDSTHT